MASSSWRSFSLRSISFLDNICPRCWSTPEKVGYDGGKICCYESVLSQRKRFSLSLSPLEPRWVSEVMRVGLSNTGSLASN